MESPEDNEFYDVNFQGYLTDENYDSDQLLYDAETDNEEAS